MSRISAPIAATTGTLRGATASTLSRLACALMTVSALLFALPDEAGALPATVAMLAGGAAFIAALRRMNGNHPESAVEAQHAVPLHSTPVISSPFGALSRWNWLALGVAVVLMVSFVQMEMPPSAGWDPTVQPETGISQHLQFAQFCLAALLLVWGLGAGSILAVRRTWRDTTIRREILLVLGLTLAALLIRLVNAGDGLHVLVDELNTISEVLSLQQFAHVRILWPMTSVSPFPWLFAYLQGISAGLFGNTLLGLRGASALVGALAVPGVYLLARAIFDDRRPALLAAVILATFPPHLHFSRLALLNIVDALWGPLALAFLIRGFKRGGRMDFAIGGACLGLTQYFYEGGRLFFPLFIVVWLLWMLLTRQRIHWRGLLLFVVTAVAVSLPLYYTWALLDAPLAGRLGSAGMGGDYWSYFLLSGAGDGWLAIQLDQVARALLVFVGMPESSVYYGGTTALVLPLLVPFFLLGLFYALYRWRTPLFMLFLWVFLTAMSSGWLMLNSAAATRYIGAMPALAVLIAAGAWYGLPLAFSRLALTRRAVLASACAAVIVVQGGYYFAIHLPYYNVQARRANPAHDVDDAMLRAAALPAGTQVQLFSQTWFDSTYPGIFMAYLNPSIPVTAVQSSAVTAAYLDALPRGVDYAFFVEPDDALTLALLKRAFHLDPPQYSPYGVPADEQFALYMAPAAEQVPRTP